MTADLLLPPALATERMASIWQRWVIRRFHEFIPWPEYLAGEPSENQEASLAV